MTDPFIKLTRKEEEIMHIFWTQGPLFVKDLLAHFDEPRPHFNTVSTFVRALEEKGFLSHRAFGTSYQYFALIDQDRYSQMSLGGVIDKYFNRSALRAVSSLVEAESLSVEELKQLISLIENRK